MTFRKTLTLTTITTASAIALFALFTISFTKIRDWLEYSDPLPAKPDLLFTFCGESRRTAYSIDLYRTMPATTWIISHRNKHRYFSYLQKCMAIDTTPLVFVDTCRSTWSEIDFLHSYCLEREKSDKPVRSIALVSSPTHMRRIRMMTRKRFKETNIAFSLLPVPQKYYGKTRAAWPLFIPAERRSVFLEMAKIGYFLVKRG